VNHFQRRKRGITSQFSVNTSRKKIANVMVGKSTALLPGAAVRSFACIVQAPVRGGDSKPGRRRRYTDDTPEHGRRS
jgi:hypothetical protein